MIGRWLVYMSEFGLCNMQIEHRSGAKHLNADALSRMPIRLCERLDCDDCGAHNAVVAGVMDLDSQVLDGRVFWSVKEILDAQSADLMKRDCQKSHHATGTAIPKCHHSPATTSLPPLPKEPDKPKNESANTVASKRNLRLPRRNISQLRRCYRIAIQQMDSMSIGVIELTAVCFTFFSAAIPLFFLRLGQTPQSHSNELTCDEQH